MTDKEGTEYLLSLLKESYQQTREMCDLFNVPYPDATFDKIKRALHGTSYEI